MMKLDSEIEVKCKQCRSYFYVSGGDIEILATDSAERNMGEEQFYYGSGEFTCPNCDNEIIIKYEGSEYPIGAPIDYEITLEGAEIVRGFGQEELIYDETLYSFEEESQLYLPSKEIIVTNLSYCAEEILAAISKKPKLLYGMEPRAFEELIAEIFYRNGFAVELTKHTRDGGRDIIAVRSDLGVKSKYIIECKRYAAINPIRVDLVRSLYRVQMQEGANKSILATTSFFTPDARKFAASPSNTEWAMSLKDYNDIVEWVRSSAKS